MAEKDRLRPSGSTGTRKWPSSGAFRIPICMTFLARGLVRGKLRAEPAPTVMLRRTLGKPQTRRALRRWMRAGPSACANCISHEPARNPWFQPSEPFHDVSVDGCHSGLSHLAGCDSTRTRSGSVGYLDTDAPLWMGSGIPGNMELDRSDPGYSRNHAADLDLWLEVVVRFWP